MFHDVFLHASSMSGRKYLRWYAIIRKHISVGAALLILDRWQCEGPVCGISDRCSSRAFRFYRSG